MNKNILLMGLLILLGISCRKTYEDISIINNPDPPKVEIETNIIGLVQDQYGQAVLNAKVSIGNTITLTDKNGYFRFQKVYISKDQDFLKIESPNYFVSYQSIEGLPGDLSFTRCILEERIFTNKFSSDADAIYTYNHLYEVYIPADALMKSDGSLFHGTYKVAPKYKDSSITRELQSGVITLDEKNSKKLLHIQHHLGIEVRSIETGEPLYFSKSIQVKYNINTSHLSPLVQSYSFNTKESKWKYNGQVTLEPNQLSIITNNPEQIAIGVSYSYTTCEGMAIFNKNNGMSFSRIANSLNGQSIHNTRIQYSGKFKLFVVQDKYQEMIFQDECQGVNSVFPVNVNQLPIVKDLIVDNPLNFAIELSGKAIYCDGSPITEGYILAKNKANQSIVFPITSQGNFNSLFFSCNKLDMLYTATDLVNDRTSEIITTSSVNNSNSTFRICENKVSSIARFSFNHIDTSYSICRVRKISNPNSPNVIFIFEYGSNGIFTEKLILERLNNPTTGNYWRLTSSSFISATYQLKEIIDDPEIFFFELGGVQMLECNLPKVIIEDQSSMKKYTTDLVFFRAIIQ